MKKTAFVFVAVILMSLLGACSSTEVGGEKEQGQTIQTAEADAEDKKAEIGDMKDNKGNDAEPEAGSNVLIAYFTWGDNTVVDNPESVDVDATTSASVLPPGNVARMAEWISQETGGELFSIKVTEPYSSDYDECLDRAAEEKAENARPKLTEKVKDIEEYDTVFLGYPNWWYSVPMPVLTFIDENDLAGKKIVLFCSHGTGGLAGSVDAITAELPADCEVEENIIGIYRDDIPDGQGKVQEWLSDIGY